MSESVGAGTTDTPEQWAEKVGRARRERIATAVLAGMAVSYYNASPSTCAWFALEWADALIAELDKPQEKA